MRLIASLVLLALFSIAACAPTADLIDKKAAQIPGYVKNQMYGGYLDVSQDKKFYYWFLEKDTSPERAPVVLWLNGGPGCSSLMGATTENGPFLFNDGKTGFKEEGNDYAWTKLANVIYLESPGGVGFSIGPKSGPITDYQVGLDNLASIVSFFKKFPEYASNDFYISGESYAGTYIPYTVNAIHEANKNGANINLKGWAVGNGCTLPEECVTPKFQGSSIFIYDFLYDQSKYSEATRKQFEDICLKDPQGDECNNILGNIQIETGLVANNQSLGSLINPYDLYAYCFHETDSESRYSPLRNMMKNLAYRLDNNTYPKYDSIPPCADAIGAMRYFRNPEIIKALHVSPQALTWAMCSDSVGQRYESALNGSYWVYPKLVGQGYKVLIYSGDTDSVVPITGTLTWVEQLRKDLGLTLKNPWRPWFYPGNKPDNARQVGGFALEFNEDFTFVSVRGVGHMVPQWGPKKAYQMLYSYLFEDTFPSK